MTIPDDPFAIFDRIVSGKSTESDLETIRQLLTLSDTQGVVQFGKYNVNLSRGQGDIHIGDRIYQGASAEAIRDIIQSLLQKLQVAAQPNIPPLKSVDELVQQVRSRLHDDIQRLHGTMPLWGVDHWVPLGELFVDVNILEELSSSRRSELADLWQDFSQNPSYRSLDRIGLGRERQRVSGLEVLAKHTNLMVVGKPGSGKTTYLQRVVTECNAGNLQAHKIPVLIRLREFVEDGRDIAYSLERYLEQCWQLSATETQLVLNQGRSLLLLDGLDEVTGEDGKTITKQIKRFARAYPQVKMVVTCRTQSQGFERFDSVEVAGFDEPQVKAFAEHWFQTVCADQMSGQTKAQVFLGQLFREENKPIRELATTPILLSLTCAVFQQTGKFYSKRSKLYEEGLELLLEKWDERRGVGRYEIHPNFSPLKELELLSHLAAKKFEQSQYVLFEQAEIEGYIAEFLEIGQRESRAVLRAIESQHGLLIERSRQVWSFSHLTFQEYLVAGWFCDCSNWEDLSHHLTESRWREVFLLSVEQASSIDSYRLLRLMKHQLNEWTRSEIGSEAHLKDFLSWVSCKSSSVAGSYKLAAIRAFYFELVCGLKILGETGKLPTLLGLSGAEISGYKSAPRGVFILEHMLNNTLRLLQQVTSNKMFDRDIILGDHFLIYKSDDPAYMEDGKLKEKLQKLQNQLIDLKLKIKHHQKQGKFVMNNGIISQELHLLQEELRGAMMQYRNIGHHWNFSEKQEELLKKYYDANKLLVESLYVNSVAHDELRKEIEEMLLIPIAEIEKRKREKME